MVRFFFGCCLFGLFACGGKVVVDEPLTTSSGAGGTSSVSTTGLSDVSSSVGPTTTNVSSTNVVVGTTSTTMDVGPGPSSCDTTGVCQDGDGDPTNDCVSCTLTQACADAANQCGSNPDCTELIDCLNGCSTQDCQNQCMAQHPSGTQAFQNLIGCLCGNCAMSCSAECGAL